MLELRELLAQVLKSENRPKVCNKGCASPPTSGVIDFHTDIPEKPAKHKLRTTSRELITAAFSVCVILIAVLCIHNFLIEYRLFYMSSKLKELERHNQAIERVMNRLLLKNSRFKRPWNDSPSNLASDDSRNSTLQSVSDGEGSEDESLATAQTNAVDKNVATVKGQSVVTWSSRSRAKRRAPSQKRRNDEAETSPRQRERTKKASLPFIHLEVSSSETRRKQLEAGKDFNFWKKASWTNASNDHRFFHLDESSGHVSVKKDGIYLIYVQVVYHDAIGRWSAGVIVNGDVRVKCIESEQLKDVTDYTADNHGVYKQCSLTSLIKVKSKQNVSIRCMYGLRTILSQSEFTYWGMIKVA